MKTAGKKLFTSREKWISFPCFVFLSKLKSHAHRNLNEPLIAVPTSTNPSDYCVPSVQHILLTAHAKRRSTKIDMQITQSIAIPERYTMLAAEKKNEERGGSIKINRKRRRREKKKWGEKGWEGAGKKLRRKKRGYKTAWEQRKK